MSENREIIYIALASNGEINSRLALQCMNWMATEQGVMVEIFEFDGNSALAKNFFIKRFLDERKEFNKMLFINQHIIPPQNVLDMANNDYDAIAAFSLFYDPEIGILPCMFKRAGATYELIQDFPDNAIVEVDAISTDCFMVSRRILEKLSPPYFDINYNQPLNALSNEDMRFCEKIRAAGGAIFVDTAMLTSKIVKVDITRMAELFSKQMVQI